MRLTVKEILFLLAGSLSALLIFLVGISLRPAVNVETEPVPHVFPVDKPVRAAPLFFKQNTYMPNAREGTVSGSIDLSTFSAESDLIEIYDDRVWWESEHDVGDTENDHIMHWSVEEPLMRLIELVSAEGGQLEVHDAYRDQGIHAPKSLHREGRALDLTCDQLGLERLAILCWQAGFDWVYYENRNNSGAHVHCSVRRAPNHNDWIIIE